VSNLLQFSDLAPVVGADSNASKAKRGDATKQPADKVLPVEEFRTDRWKAIDADVKFTGRRIIKNKDLPITDLYTHIVMMDGVLSLTPLSFGVAGGTLSSEIHLDGSTTPLKGRFSTSARHLKLKQLFPNFKTMQNALGEINGDAALSATGNSPAALAATSNGEVKTLITDGTVSKILMEAAGLNVANVVYEKLFGTNDVKINCAAADFVDTNGVLDPRVFALDTDDAVIDIDGNVNLRDETMDLGIHPHTKGFRIFSLRSPLYVKGTFKDPHVGVDAKALALRGGAMVGLGLINPFAALIPLIAPSNNKPLPCAQLLANVGQRPSAPPPGEKEKAKAPIPLDGNAPAAASGAAATNRRAEKEKPAVAAPASAGIYKGK
jgi:AsmA family protein